MNLETFTAQFEEMCKVKFPDGASVMEIFLHLNNPNLTLGEITTYLENLKAHGKCDMSIQQGNDSVNLKIIYKYKAPPMPAPNVSTSLPFKEIGALFGQDVGAIIEKIGPLFEKILVKQDEEKQALINEEKIRHAQMMEIQKQILEHQKLILAAITKPPMSISQWTPFPNNNNSASIFQSESPLTSQTTPTPTPPVATANSTPPMVVTKVTDVKVQSFTEPTQFYNLNLDNMTCSCPNYVHHQSTLNPPGKCKHLLAAINNGVDKMIK